MINFSSLPRWRDLLKLPFCRAPSDEVLSRPWCKERDFAVWFSKTTHSLYTIVQWWQKSFSKKTPTLWVPSFFSNQSLWPIRQLNVKIVFYPLQEQLLPDWEACARLATETPPDIFILSHFYGCVADTKTAKEFCEAHSALMVEDATHILVPTGDVGERGHFVLYSPHKFFAISQGALCIVRLRTQKYVQKQTGQWIDIEKIRDSSRQMGPWAKKMLFFELNRIPAYIEHRRKCAQEWEYVLAQNDIPLMRVSISSQDIPYMAVFNTEDDNASELYQRLEKKGWPVSNWPDLPPEVSANPAFFAKTIHFKNNMLVFPVNQSIRSFEIVRKYGLLKLKETVGRWIKVDRAQWSQHFAKVQKSNLLQHWVYGDAKSVEGGWTAQRFVLMQGEQPRALLQVLEKRVLRFFKLIRINRGPLWIEGDTSAKLPAFQLLKKKYSWYSGTLLCIAPELDNTVENKSFLFQLKYQPFRTFKWHSIWIDLSQSEIELRSALRSNWRRGLAGSEKEGLTFTQSNLKNDWSNFLEKYQTFRQTNQFDGISDTLLNELVSAIIGNPNSNITGYLYNIYYHEEHLVAGALTIKHGFTATYLLVWSDEQGRACNASNFLIWNMMNHLKTEGCFWLDLGGISEKTPATKDITHFKRGLGGEEYYLVGDYLGI